MPKIVHRLQLYLRDHLTRNQISRDKNLFSTIFPRLLRRPYRLAVRTLPFHGGNTGSIPVRVANPPKEKMSGLIAIVGRPNVGKSALFNRIAGRRIAIVHDQPGVTRDRVSAEVEWNGRPFTLVDTGGIGLWRGETAPDIITKAAIDQVQMAIESANAIILVVNAREGLVPLDEEVAYKLRLSGKPVIVAVNKVDHHIAESLAPEFTQLGFEKMFSVSAIHNRGIDELTESAISHLPVHTHVPAEDRPPALKLAIIGRPNVGKSSIINALTQSERVIVSPIAGTTRDAVDVPFEVDTGGVRESYLLIDTAGLRKKTRVDNSVEFFSVKRAEESIERADITLLILDAVDGITEQEKKIADKIVAAKKACIVVVNKWDLLEESVRVAREEELVRRKNKTRARDDRDKTLTTLGEFGQWIQEKLFFLSYAPVIFTSAKSGFHLDRLLESIRYVAAQLEQKVPTSILNRTLADAIERRQPVSLTGHFLNFFYATHTGKRPHKFLLFINRDELLSPQYEKYLAEMLRKAFGFEGCPIVFVARARPRKIAPIRRPSPNQPVARRTTRHSKRPNTRPPRSGSANSRKG